ncbi:hypothetical protein, partial [Streptococcus suis]|uniref:hypothetical protein n=1 Tax=Streptococcus suis TaxID=1307 RepID=UPI00163AEA01
SQSLSSSASESVSLSSSTSASESASSSASTSVSLSASATFSTSEVGQETSETLPQSSQTQEPGSEDTSLSSNQQVLVDGNKENPITLSGFGQGLSLLSSATAATATASSETVTGLLATNLDSNSSSRSETTQSVKTVDRVANINYIVKYEREDGSLVSADVKTVTVITAEASAKNIVSVEVVAPDGYSLADGQASTISQEVTESGANLLTVKVVKKEDTPLLSTPEVEAAKKVLEQVSSEALVLSNDVLRRFYDDTEKASLVTLATDTKNSAIDASILLSSASATEEELLAKAEVVRTETTRLAEELRLQTGTEEVSVALATDNVAPVLLEYAKSVILFNKIPMNKELVVAKFRENTPPSEWKLYGFSLHWDNMGYDAIVASGTTLDRTLGLTVVARATGTANEYEYVIKGTPIHNGDVTGATFFSRRPLLIDGNYKQATVNWIPDNGTVFVIVEVSDGNHFINMNWNEQLTDTIIQNKTRLITKSGQPWQRQDNLNSLTISVKGAKPAVNQSGNVNVTLATPQGLTTNANIYINYPPKIENAASQIFVFNNTATTVATRIATVSDTAGQTVRTSVANDGGLAVDTSGTIPTGKTFTTGPGYYRRTLTATDNYNNSSSHTFAIRSYNVSDSSMTAEAGTKVTTAAILDQVKASVTGGGSDGLAGSGLENLSSYSIVSGYDHEPTVGPKTVRVRVTLTGGNYKEVDVTVNYQDTTAPTITEPRTIYVFKDTQMTQSLQLAKMSDAGTGINTTTSGTSNLQGLTLTKNSTDGNKNVTLLVSGTTNAGVGQYNQTLTAVDQGQPLSTTNSQAVIQVISAADSTIQRTNHTPITWSEIKDKVASTLDGNHADAGLSYKLLVNGTPVNDANVTASHIPTVDGSVTVRLTTDYNGVDDAGVYKDVVVTLDYPEREAPVVSNLSNQIFIFKDTTVNVADSNFNHTSNKLAIGTIEDATGIQTVEIVNNNNSNLNNSEGLTLTADGTSATSKTLNISGQTNVSSLVAGNYYNKIKSTDTLGTVGISAQYTMSLLNVQDTYRLPNKQISDAKYTDEEIVNVVKNYISNNKSTVFGTNTTDATANENVAALTYKVVANANHNKVIYKPDGVTNTDHTVTVRIRTSSGTYKDVLVNFKYVDTIAPTLTTNDLYVFNGVTLTTPVDVINQKTDAGTGINNASLRIQESDTGLTINANEQVTGTYTASAAGLNTRHVQVSDNSTDNNGGPNTATANLKILIVNPQNTSLTKELTGGVKYTNDEIKQAVLDAMKANNYAAFGDLTQEQREASGLLSSSAYTVRNEHDFTSGEKTVRVQMRNAQGNIAVVNVTINYTNDAPVISNQTNLSAIKRSDSTSVTLDLSTAVTVTDTEDDRSTTDANNTSVTYKIKGPDGTVLKTVTALKRQSAPINVNELTAGTYTVNVEATDSVGTTTTSSFQLTVKD